MSEYFYVEGRDGKLVRNLITEDEFDIGEKIIELDPKKMIPNERSMDYYSARDTFDELERIYYEWGNFGKFGDIICMECC